MLESPQTFDQTITGYVELFDRETWPLIQRCIAIAAARGTIPTYYIPRTDLSEEQQEKLKELGAENTDESVQGQVLSEEAS